MKLIIDMDEDVRVAITRVGLLRISDEMQKEVDRAIQSGTPISDNATNGDMIKAMFPNGTTAKFVTFMRFIDGEHYFNCSEEWWNAPYQKGGKE